MKLSDASAIYVGAVEASKVYVGATEVWSASAPPPPPSVVGNSQGVDVGAGTLTTAPTMPSGVQDGDRLFLAMMVTDSSAGVTVTPTVPAGWTVVNAIANQGTCQRALYTAVYSAGLAMPSWAYSASRRGSWACVAVRNVTAYQTSLTDLGSSGAVLTAPAITATGAGLTLRMFVRKDNLSTSVTTPASHTLIASALGLAGPAPHVMTCQAAQAAAGTTGTAACTWSASSANGTSWTVSIT